MEFGTQSETVQQHHDHFLDEAHSAADVQLRPEVVRLLNQVDKIGLDRKRPLWRVDLIRGGNESVVLLRVDQTLADGFSMMVIAEALLGDKNGLPVDIQASYSGGVEEG